MSTPDINHTEDIWQNWPLRVEVMRSVTLNDALSDIARRRLAHIAIRHGNDTVIRLDWSDARALRDALTRALEATADLYEEDCGVPNSEPERHNPATNPDCAFAPER